MCILFLALGCNEHFPVIIASNRDEYIDRETAIAHFWNRNNGNRIIGGIDLKAGGTWLAASNQGRFAVVLNCVQPKPPADGFLSRGEIVVNYVDDDGTNGAFTEDLLAKCDHYKPFNFVGIRFKRSDSIPSAFVTKPSEYLNGYSTYLDSGLHVLGNLPFGCGIPLKKIDHGKETFKNTLEMFANGLSHDFDTLQTMLVKNLLSDGTCCFPDPELQKMWKEQQQEHVKSIASIFVSIPSLYQTRCSTIVAVDKKGMCHFVEYTWAAVESNLPPKPSRITRETFELAQ